LTLKDITEKLAHSSNYGAYRDTKTIEYIVIHYTANDGDASWNNANYFQKNPNLKTSAHIFVDDSKAYLSVPLNRVAYSVGSNTVDTSRGGGKYYKKCTNANSINIELCDTVRDGKRNVTQKTINNALDITRELMYEYNIPASHVIRHFDVTGKLCPEYWIDKAKWESEFHSKVYKLNGWYQDGDEWYYFENGVMSHDKWINDNGQYYYLKSSGQMAFKEFIKSKDYDTNKKLYWINIDGTWDGKSYRWMSNEKGWWITQIDGTWYPKEEWYKISGSWYYFDSKGYMVTGTKTIDGRIYSFNSNGELVG
jgi:glucan-binding YG repeat protein